MVNNAIQLNFPIKTELGSAYTAFVSMDSEDIQIVKITDESDNLIIPDDRILKQIDAKIITLKGVLNG